MPNEAPPEYKLYRTRPRLLPRASRDGASVLDDLRRRPPRGGPGRPRRRVTPGRVVLWIVAALVGWVVLAVVAFVVSATINQDRVSGETRQAVSGEGTGILGDQVTLVLGSDKRSKSTSEPGSADLPSRADSIMLLRTGGGSSAKLSIPRDTRVPIPGGGASKINAAYARGGAALTVKTVEDYLGVEIDHVFEVNFENFPELIDAMGGIDYSGGCVISRINGGARNGGTTLRLRRGTTHIDGDEALALARTRKNLCNKREDDRTRARRQQKILAAMKDQVFSVGGYLRLPFIAWDAPKALRTDMGGVELLGYVVGTALAGDAPTRVLQGSPAAGGSDLVVSEEEKRTEVRRFLGD